MSSTSPQLQALRSFVCNVSSLLPSGPLCFCVFVISSLLLQAPLCFCVFVMFRKAVNWCPWCPLSCRPSASSFFCNVSSLLSQVRCVSVCSSRFVLVISGPLCFCVFVTFRPCYWRPFVFLCVRHVSSLLLGARCVSACSSLRPYYCRPVVILHVLKVSSGGEPESLLPPQLQLLGLPGVVDVDGGEVAVAPGVLVVLLVMCPRVAEHVVRELGGCNQEIGLNRNLFKTKYRYNEWSWAHRQVRCL